MCVYIFRHIFVESSKEEMGTRPFKKEENYEYDAFVIYNPHCSDIDFVKAMAEILEGPLHNLRLFIPWRNEEIQQSYISAELIEKRCKKCIVVLSQQFAENEVADFQLKIAQSLSPINRSTRLIPICLEKCELPCGLKSVATLDYHKSDVRTWFWKRLTRAFSSVQPACTKEEKDCIPLGQSLPDIVLDTSSEYIRSLWK